MNLLYEIVNYPPVHAVLLLLGSAIFYVLLGCIGHNRKEDSE